MSTPVSVSTPTHLRRRRKIVGIVCGSIFQRNRLCLFVLLFCSHISPAQQNNYTDPFTSADNELNSAYKQALTRFAPQNQEILRRGERAWIAFSDKQEAVLGALRRENLLTQDAENAATIAEINARSNHLRVFYGGTTVPFAEPYILQNLDQKLGEAYAACMRRLNSNDQHLLRDAERAWITYRDADTAAAAIVYNKQVVVTAATAHLTAIRYDQLTALTNAPRQAAITETPVQQPPVKNDSPDPEDVKTVAKFRDEAKDMFKALLAMKDDPFFKEADAIKNVPDLPHEMADSISKVGKECQRIFQDSKFTNLREAASNEFRTVSILEIWPGFIRQLKTGDVTTAGNLLHTALKFQPKDTPPDYLPLWQTIQRWDELFQKDYLKFQNHITKAKDLAGRGKTSDAIKEYEAAYGIIENSSIPEEIKKLRKESLGL